MRRILVLLAVLAVLAAACSSDDTADTTTTTAAPDTTTTTEAPAESSTTTTTAAPTTTSTTVADIPTEPIVPGEDPDADEIAALYDVVFDSATGYEEKAPLIDDPTGLESTVEAYGVAGEGVGGIMLQAKEAGFDGDRATVIYDLLFAGNPFQPDQVGDAVRNDGTWQVTRDFFCSIMELARVPCP